MSTNNKIIPFSIALTEIEEIKFKDIITTTTELFEESTESILENFNTLPPDTFEKEQLELDQIVENMVPIDGLDEIEEINVEIPDYEEIITTQVPDETTTLIGNIKEIEEIEYIDDQSLNSIIANQESVLPKETQLCQGDFNIRRVYLYLIFEMSIWEFITNSKKKSISKQT